MTLRDLIDYLIRVEDGLDRGDKEVLGHLSIEVPDDDPIVLDIGPDQSHTLIDLSKWFKKKE